MSHLSEMVVNLCWLKAFSANCVSMRRANPCTSKEPLQDPVLFLLQSFFSGSIDPSLKMTYGTRESYHTSACGQGPAAVPCATVALVSASVLCLVAALSGHMGRRPEMLVAAPTQSHSTIARPATLNPLRTDSTLRVVPRGEDAVHPVYTAPAVESLELGTTSTATQVCLLLRCVPDVCRRCIPKA